MKSLTCLIAILGLLVAATHAQNDEEPTRKRTLDHMISRVMKRGNSGFSRMISRVMRRSDPDFYNSYEDQLNVSTKRIPFFTCPWGPLDFCPTLHVGTFKNVISEFFYINSNSQATV